MVHALRQKVVVQSGGVIEIQSSELAPGTEAEVIVLIESLSGEDMDDLRAYDAAKATGDEIIPFKQAIAEIEQNR